MKNATGNAASPGSIPTTNKSAQPKGSSSGTATGNAASSSSPAPERGSSWTDRNGGTKQ